MTKISFLIFALGVIITINVEARPVKPEDKFKFNCIIRHLKSSNLIDDDYPEHSGAIESGDCGAIVEDAKELVYTKLASDLKGKDFNKHKTCIMTNLRSRKYSENNLKQSIFLSSETMSQEEIGRKVNSLIRRNKIVVQETTKLCLYNDLFGKLFDELFDKSTTESEEEDDEISEYCIRKHVVDSNQVDTKIYKVSLNPKNLNVHNVNCKERIESENLELLESIEEVLESDPRDAITSDCARQRFLNASFANKLMEIGVLSQLSLTEAQKEVERKRFLEFVNYLVKSVVTC